MNSRKHVSRKKVKAEQKQQDSQLQDLFLNQLARILNESKANELRCYASSGKPCACLSKYILYGSKWKEKNSIGLDKSVSTIQDLTNGQTNLQANQAARAQELIGLLHHAANLKKEKCYDSNEDTDGKAVKELKGMIGLGNGRKRSKNYELFVLEKRELLREEYSLCEKAAQKVLGYSINFLYKKLRTNPEKNSRLGATSKVDKVTKPGRQLVSIEELQNKALNGQDPCCSRNCIRTLVTQQRTKIEDWRRRLEGCSQKVAQQIVAEVLREAGSLDGPTSFCQNVVQWVTGCSFKKIRRVREHLKKDPQSLPEHGLKRYWKDKERGQAVDGQYKLLETSANQGATAISQSSHEARSFASNTAAAMERNQNNSSNRYTSNQMEYQQSASSKAPPNQSLPVGLPPAFPSAPPSDPTSMYLPRGGNTLQSSYATHSVYSQDALSDSLDVMPPNITLNQVGPMEANFQTAQIPLYNSQAIVQGYQPPMIVQNSTSVDQQPFIPTSHASMTSQYSELQPPKLTTTVPAESSRFQMYPTPLAASFDPSATGDNQQYFIAANPEQFQQDAYQTGMTPLIIAQAQQIYQSEDGASQPKQSFFLFSPPPVPDNNGGQNSENWGQFLPLTPVQMYPAQYLHTGQQNDSDQGEGQQQAAAAFMMSNTEAQMEVAPENNPSMANPAFVQVGQPQGQFPPNLTPVAIMQGEGSFVSGWRTAQSFPQALTGNNDQLQTSTNAAGEASVSSEAKPSDQMGQQIFQLQNFNPQLLNQQQGSQPNPNIFPKFFLPGDIPSGMEGISLFLGENQEVQASEDSTTAEGNEKGAAVSDRNKRFSRDRLRATIDSPCIVSILTPVASLAADKGAETNNVQQGNALQVFNFPPTNVSRRRMAALRMEGSPSEQGNNKPADSKVSTADNSANTNAANKLPSVYLSNSGSLGDVPEDLLQNNNPLLSHFSGMKSLPVLNLPSAGWSNENILVKNELTEGQMLEREGGNASTESQSSNVKIETQNSVPNGDEEDVKPLLPAPGKKKRKVDGSNLRGVSNQKQIRFHIFTPSDFANGQVNVSQFRKPSVFASSATNIPEPAKKRQKLGKKSSSADIGDTVKTETAKEDATRTETKPVTEPSTTANASTSLDVKITDPTKIPDISVPLPTTESFPMPPLKTPAVLKNFPPNVKVGLPSSETSNTPTPMQLNTPVFMHSGKLLTPSGKLNSAAFFCRVSPGQAFGSENTPSTSQIFNFMPNSAFFLAPDPQKVSAKSSESSEDSEANKSSSIPLNRSHMTLNLTSKSGSSEDSLHTPSKILVVTPSGMLGAKLTPDLQPSFSFQELLEKFSPEEVTDRHILNKTSTDSSSKVEESSPLPPATSDTATTSSKLEETRSVLVANSSDGEMPSVDPAPATDKPEEEILNQRRRSEEDGKLVIALDESPKPPNPPSPLETPTIHVVTPTVANHFDPLKNRFPGSKPQSLKVNSSLSQAATSTFYHLMSPNQKQTSSPTVVLFPFNQKGSSSLSTASLLSPVFGFMPRPTVSGGGHTSLRRSALIKQLPVFQFPPAPKSKCEKEEGVSKPDEPESTSSNQAVTDDHKDKECAV